ncbi:hypothetical protein B0H17DRAFT_1138902 [Mycena rosella]|uniref:MULE transposase domain-containing protein n=1 Tax=Mycena rosella TaxID=1033263 RepID=A0AAD7D6T3_MYCRO|nr:hypothetical protein B0H17DRAFT_1138902 [Mycena rosella]
MNAAAWKYGHENQIMLDGTFGICDSRLLLFIVMVIDENRRGVPVAFLMFSAPTGKKQSSSGYNTEILTKLICAWKEDLQNVGTVTRFWGWSSSWKNHRNKLLKGKSRLKIDLKHRLKRLEDSLVETKTIQDARGKLPKERELLSQLRDETSIQKAIAHVDYLDSYWTTDNLWKSWSDFGRKVAPSLLECETDGVHCHSDHQSSRIVQWSAQAKTLATMAKWGPPYSSGRSHPDPDHPHSPIYLP